jgi:hypothetical protein
VHVHILKHSGFSQGFSFPHNFTALPSGPGSEGSLEKLSLRVVDCGTSVIVSVGVRQLGRRIVRS